MNNAVPGRVSSITFLTSTDRQQVTILGLSSRLIKPNTEQILMVPVSVLVPANGALGLALASNEVQWPS